MTLEEVLKEIEERRTLKVGKKLAIEIVEFQSYPFEIIKFDGDNDFVLEELRFDEKQSNFVKKQNGKKIHCFWDKKSRNVYYYSTKNKMGKAALGSDEELIQYLKDEKARIGKE